MAERRQKLTMHEPAVFHIKIQGFLDDSWSDYFGTQSVSVEVDEEGVAVTTFTTEPIDQAALVGVINRLNGLVLPLLAVEVHPEQQSDQAIGGQARGPMAVDPVEGK